jgi:sortase (surface protein transpeptidase)
VSDRESVVKENQTQHEEKNSQEAKITEKKEIEKKSNREEEEEKKKKEEKNLIFDVEVSSSSIKLKSVDKIEKCYVFETKSEKEFVA